MPSSINPGPEELPLDLPLSKLFSPKLLHFTAIYKFRNIRRAAEEIRVSQPALSKSLKGLEKQLGVELFVRSKSGMAPTEAGETFARHMERLFDLAREAEIEIAGLNDLAGGKIRIGAGQMWSWLFIPKIVEEFSRKFPSTNLSVSTAPMRELMPRLVEDQLDLAVGDFDGLDVTEEFQMHHAWSPEFCAFASADHPLANQAMISAADLVKYQWSGYIDHDVFEHKVRFWCRKNGLEYPDVSIRASSMATLLRLTRAGNNIAFLPGELEGEAGHWGLVPLKQKNLDLWSVRTGSIIRERKASVEQYRYLLDLIQAAGQKPSEFLTPEP